MFAIFLLLLPLLATADEVLTQTNCADCTLDTLCSESADAIVYSLPVSKCYSPAELFPDDDLWGTFDMMDVCRDKILVRTFYNTTDGSCGGDLGVPTDEYKLQYDHCLGPFGEKYPWGAFECS